MMLGMGDGHNTGRFGASERFLFNESSRIEATNYEDKSHDLISKYYKDTGEKNDDEFYLKIADIIKEQKNHDGLCTQMTEIFNKQPRQMLKGDQVNHLPLRMVTWSEYEQ